MLPGELVGDRFDIEQRVAAGGMGAVYRARDRVSGAPVAVKVMLRSDDTAEERFVREAAMLAELSHESIVSYVAHGASPWPWLAMEWLDGEDLAARLLRGPLSIEDALVVARRIAEALSMLHRRGLVHRDVKPSNVFLVGGDPARAKLLDLGVARSFADPSALTQTGFAIGTPYYMAPEQARAARDLDARADVFALGCVFFECVAGTPPFRGQNIVEVLAKIVLEPAPLLSERVGAVPGALDALVERMLAKDREQRPIDGAAVADELDVLARATSSRSVRRAGIGVRERRVLSLVLTGRADPFAVTLARVDGDPLGAIRTAAERASARIEPLADGSVLLVLTEPAVAIDQARAAAQLALEIRASSPTLPLAIASGRAETTAGAPIGDTVERVARALDHAADGKIRIDAASAAMLGGRFEIAHDDAGSYLCGERADAIAARLLLGKRTSFVGRDRELSVLEGLFDECLDEPRARAAVVTAPAGAGKSRFRDELIARAKKREPRLEVLLGIADVARAGTPFGLLSAAVRRSASIADGAPAEAQRAQLRARVGRSLTGPALERVLPFIGEIASVHFADDTSEALRAARRDPMLMGDAVRTAFEEWTRAECARGPLAIVLDDVHWGDASTMRVLDSTLRVLADQALFVLALARPEVHEVFPGLFRERDVQELRLSAIGKRACERLVREALGDGAPDHVVAWVIDRAAGNAFFLEELIRAASHESRAGDVPDTVLGVVQARLDALGPAGKRVLRAGSVFGETFWRAGIDAVMSEPATQGVLSELIAAEVIEDAPRARFQAEAAYAFRHALVRDAAYAMLTIEDRAIAHQRAAEWLEARGEVDPVELAEHCVRAGDTARAARFFADAADAALEGNDLAGADAHARQGIECGADAELLGRLRLVQTIAAMWRGDHAGAVRLSDGAMELLPEGSARWFRAAAESMSACGRTGDRAALERVSQRLLTATAADDARDEQVIALCRSMIPLSNAGGSNTDLVLSRAIEIAEQSPSLGAMARAQLLEARGLRLIIANDASGMPLLEAALEAYESAGAIRDRCLTAGSLAWARYHLGFNEEALTAADRALSLANTHALEQPRSWATFLRGCVLVRLGRNDDAIVVLRSCIPMYQRQGNARHIGWAGAVLAAALLATGQIEAAAEQAANAAALLAEVPMFGMLALAVQARALIALGRTTEARPLLSRARLAAGELTGTPLNPHVWIAEAELARAEGDLVAARDVVARALDSIHALAAQFDDAARARYLAIPEHALLLRMAKE